MSFKKKITIFNIHQCTLENILLVCSILLGLLFIWVHPFFITSDGAVHLYNATILHDLLLHHNEAFYHQFYKVNSQVNGNWLLHGLLTLLLLICSAATAEKCIVTLYFILFMLGFFKLFKFYGKQHISLLILISLFVFNVPIARGFYSFSYCIALFPWILFSGLQIVTKSSFKQVSLFILCSLTSFFFHPLGHLLSVIILFCCVLGNFLHNPKKLLPRDILILLITTIPILSFGLLYNNEHNETPFHLCFNLSFILKDLVRLSSFQLYSNFEVIFLIFGALIISFYFIFIFSNRIKNQIRINQSDGILIGIFCLGCIYLFVPDSYACELIQMRVQIFIWLTLLIYISCSSTVIPHFKKGVIIIFICYTCLSVIRIEKQNKLNETYKEMSEIDQYLTKESTILCLYFNQQGTKKEQIITSNLSPLLHVFQYLGAKKTLFFLDNYEANLTWFPLKFIKNKNPYTTIYPLNCIESENPTCDLQNNTNINFIAFWGYNPTKNVNSISLVNQIFENYNLIMTSQKGNVFLFKNKK
jgi:hypothetical protein